MMRNEIKAVLDSYSKRPDSIIMRFAELSLKKNNRPMFKRQLKQNIEQQLSQLQYKNLHSLQGGFLLGLSGDSEIGHILARLRKLAGLAWLAPGWSIKNELDAFASVALEAGQEIINQSSTFGLDTQRSDKNFPHNSMECNRIVGGKIDQATDLTVDLDDPDWKINLHVLTERAHLFFHRFEGVRGLPVGTTGNVLVLLSGGIDSPVATLKAFKRGCRADFIHFYAYSSPREALEKNIRKLVNKLVPFGWRGRLFLVPDMPFQICSKDLPKRLQVVLFRRHIMRVAQKIARKNDLQALVTGESLGQVASQTIENLTSIEAPVDLPVLRPLVGMDKQEIVNSARKWGTFEISTRDYKDCCAIQANHPRTRTEPKKLSRIEAKFDLPAVDKEAYHQIDVYEYDQNGLGKKTVSSEQSKV